MAPLMIVSDYYKALGVTETAPADIIKQSYKQLALRFHPDKNTDVNATKIFQLVCSHLLPEGLRSTLDEKRRLLVRLTHMFWLPKIVEAYETLGDEAKRRAYDRDDYSRIKATSKGSPTSATGTPYSAHSTADPDKCDVSRETAEILAIYKAKGIRVEKWSKAQKVYDDAIFNLTREIRKLQNAIKQLDEIDKTEDAEEALAKSWTTWLLSPMYQKRVETEEEKEKKAGERLQRLHSRNFKERDMRKKESELKDYEDLLRSKREEFDNANKKDDATRYLAEERMRAKRAWAQQEKDRVEKERRSQEARRREAELAKAAKERQERQENAAAEQRKKRQSEEAERMKQWKAEEAARKKREEEISRAYWEEVKKGPGARASTACHHPGWWHKVHKVDNPITCEKCHVSHHGFLLQCPSCNMKACCACQKKLRLPKRRLNRGRSDQEPRYGRADTKPSFSETYYNDFYD
jgi:hypothetical protein